jgi:hypothetical protein
VPWIFHFFFEKPEKTAVAFRTCRPEAAVPENIHFLPGSLRILSVFMTTTPAGRRQHPDLASPRHGFRRIIIRPGLLDGTHGRLGIKEQVGELRIKVLPALPADVLQGLVGRPCITST